MRWTEDEFAAFQNRKGIRGAKAVADTSAPPFLPPANEAGAFARGRLLEGGMNKIEGDYANHLDLLKHAGDVLWWRYAPMRLRLADGSYYKPDFGVMMRDFLFEIHETKGHWREAARVRIKVAAGLFPFKFIAITRAKGGGWEREEFA